MSQSCAALSNLIEPIEGSLPIKLAHEEHVLLTLVLALCGGRQEPDIEEIVRRIYA
jgi:hypothetical protein